MSAPVHAIAPNAEVLKFERATLVSDGGSDPTLIDASFALRAGELAVIYQPEARNPPPIADAGSGLATPIEGAVKVFGRDWRRRTPGQAAQARGEIGRLFAAQNWLNYMSVGDNMIFARLHHSSAPESRLRQEAAAVSRHFGLPGLPLSRPADMSPADLQRAACARAFLGEPKLIILEEPLRGLDNSGLGPLVNSIGSARSRDAAVVIITHDRGLWELRSLRASIRAEVVGARLRFEQP